MRGDETIKRVLDQRANEDERRRSGSRPPAETDLDRALEEGAAEEGGGRPAREAPSSGRR